ncbi:hypothetical protein [Spirosoma pulveris]
MATSYAVRSFRNSILALAFLGLLTTACKKSGGVDDVDPRDQYIGTYEGGYQSVIRFGGAELKPETGTTTVTVTKSSNAKEIYIDIKGNRPYQVTAELNGASFNVIDRTQDQIYVQGTTFTGNYSATGVFDKNQFAMSTTTETLQGGTVISRAESIMGVKK